MDLSKMSVGDLLAMCDECNYPGITDELARRLAAAEASREQTIKNWEADIRHMDANRAFYKREIDTLRQQLAVAREGLEKVDQGTAWVSILEMCKIGMEEWANKPHNRKWWRRIDGTPIPNDLMICVAKAVQDALDPHHRIASDTLARLDQMGEKP